MRFGWKRLLSDVWCGKGVVFCDVGMSVVWLFGCDGDMLIFGV